jgi:GntR family transcriptional regulator
MTAINARFVAILTSSPGNRPVRQPPQLRKNRIIRMIGITLIRAQMLSQPPKDMSAGAAPSERAGPSAGLPRGALLAPDPLYKQVRNALVDSLARGEWKPGEMIPTERRLAERYGVGIATIRAAITELAAAKIVARRQGKGTFVCLQDERRSIYQFFHVVRNDGVKELPVSELLSLKRARADAEAAHALNLPRKPSALEVFKLRNVLKVGGRRVVVSDIVIPAALFPGLTEDLIRTGGVTLYAVYQTHFGINIIRTSEQLRAVRADATTARILSLVEGDPVLEVRRTAYTFNDVPVEVRRSRVETDHYYYSLDQGNTR